MADSYKQAEWLEWSRLPAMLNEARSGAWPVFKKLVELDCARNVVPATVEVSPAELAERCGMGVELVGKCLEAARRKRCLRFFMPDHPDEDGLFEVATPLPTPIPPEEVARTTPDPHLRDTTFYRYARPAAEDRPAEHLVREVVDLYLGHLSQKINSFVVEQIELAVRRFDIADIRRVIERAERHDIHAMGWVLKQLIHEQDKRRKKPA